MTPLTRAWLLLTVYLITPGSIRWHLLSYFFNPLWLIPCYFFVWLKALRKWVSLILFLPFKVVVLYFIFPVYRFLVALLFRNTCSMASKVWPEESIDCEASEEDEDFHNLIPGIEWFRIFEESPLVIGYARIEGVQNVVKETLNAEEHQDTNESLRAEVQEVMNELESMLEEQATNESVRVEEVPEVEEEVTATDDNQNEVVEEKDHNSTEEEDTVESIDESISEAVSYNTGGNVLGRISTTGTLILPRELEVEEERQVVDQFYEEYRERMTQFNRLNEDYTNNLRTILLNLVWNSELPQKFAGLVLILTDNTEWSEAVRRKFIKSVRARVEMFYVGQSCLCSEALQYQYRKIQEMVSSAPPAGFPCNKIAAKFLHFRILLERFVEDERMRGERFWNYSQFRHRQYKDLLLVPSLSDQLEADRTGGKDMELSELLNAVEECIVAFLKFFESDDGRKPSVSLRKFLLWNIAQVEDANDLKMLSDIKRTLREKEAALKNLQTENRPSLSKRKRRNQIQDWYRVECLCCSIDLKLVARVLAMPIISTKQLQWCQDVLANIRFDGSQLKRSRLGLLFPCPWSEQET